MRNEFEHQEKIPQISTNVFKKINNEALSEPIENRRFSIKDIQYALVLSPSKNVHNEPNGEPAEYIAQPNEWAIYIWEDLPERIQRTMLFHEIAEVYFRVTYKMDETAAHTAALRYEEPIMNAFLTEDEKEIIKKIRS